MGSSLPQILRILRAHAFQLNHEKETRVELKADPIQRLEEKTTEQKIINNLITKEKEIVDTVENTGGHRITIMRQKLYAVEILDRKVIAKVSMKRNQYDSPRGYVLYTNEKIGQKYNHLQLCHRWIRRRACIKQKKQ